MTQAEKKMKKYTNSVERRLNLPREVKARVMSDFISSIAARREAGQSDEEIYEDLGTPAKAAADLNEQMKDYAYRKSPWRFLCLGIAVVAGAQLLYDAMIALVAHCMAVSAHRTAASIGIIGGADGPTAIFLTAPRLDENGMDGGAARRRRGGISAAAALQGQVQIILAKNINVCYNTAHVLCNFPKEA